MSKENSTTKICKYCKTEIPKDAKICPNCRKKQNKIMPLLIVIVLIIIVIAAVSGNDKSPSQSVSNSEVGQSNTNNKTNKEETKQEETKQETNKTIGINEEFGNNTMTCKVTSFDENYTGYNEIWTQVPEGKHCIFVTFEMNNKSDKDNYVSVGDFDCYVDNVITNAELISGSDLDYNANISAGRTAILGGLYIVPDDCESIELEYHPIGEKNSKSIIKLK